MMRDTDMKDLLGSVRLLLNKFGPGTGKKRKIEQDEENAENQNKKIKDFL